MIIDLTSVVFTQHALDRLVEHCPDPLKNPERTARKLLRRAAEEPLDPVVLLNKNFENARYFRNGCWRFMIVDNLVVTCEIITPSWRKNR